MCCAQAFQPSVYIFCSQLQQVSRGGVHAVPSMAFGAAQDTRPPPPSWPALSLPAGADYVFVELTIGCSVRRLLKPWLNMRGRGHLSEELCRWPSASPASAAAERMCA